MTPDWAVGRGEELPPALLSAGTQEGCRGRGGGACRFGAGCRQCLFLKKQPVVI